MQIKVGIPQAMLYHEFGGLWNIFFQNMGIPVVLSGETNKQILNRGTLLAMDESCLPLKVYLGHVDALLPECSHIFVPRIAQYHPNFHFCAKFAGLPDIVQNTFRLSSDQLISPNIEHKSPVKQLQALQDTCRSIGLSAVPGYFSYRHSLKSWKNNTSGNTLSKRSIAVIGHSYLVKDAFFCHDIMNMLTSRGIAVVTPEHVDNKALYAEAKIFEPDIYWQLSAKIAGAAHFFCRQRNVIGIIVLSSFACGPDSLMNEYITHHILKKSDKPYIIISIDEHTGSAGLMTRIEAFCDLVEWREKHESSLPSYGISEHTHCKNAQ
ncbi:MAG: acyl-CoA dehydratase activase-related protein [Veillonellales bacterium]